MKQVILCAVVFTCSITFGQETDPNIRVLATEGGDDVPVAASQPLLDRLGELSTVKDLTGIDEMIRLKQVWLVQQGTRCRLIDGGFLSCEVRISSGPYNGRLAFVSTSFLRRETDRLTKQAEIPKSSLPAEVNLHTTTSEKPPGTESNKELTPDAVKELSAIVAEIKDINSQLEKEMVLLSGTYSPQSRNLDDGRKVGELNSDFHPRWEKLRARSDALEPALPEDSNVRMAMRGAVLSLYSMKQNFVRGKHVEYNSSARSFVSHVKALEKFIRTKSENPPKKDRFRTWTDASGSFSQLGKFLGFESGKVSILKENGVTIHVDLDRLSKEDKEFVRVRIQNE